MEEKPSSEKERKKKEAIRSRNRLFHLARRRLLSFFIDFSILYGLSIGFSRIVVVVFLLAMDGQNLSVSEESFGNIFLQGFSVVFPYTLLFLSGLYYCTATFFFGKTMGQSLLNTEVFSTNPHGKRLHPTLLQSILRYLGSLVSFCCMGLPFFLGAHRGQGRVFQDWLSFTEVGEYTRKRLEEVDVVELKLFRKEEKRAA